MLRLESQRLRGLFPAKSFSVVRHARIFRPWSQGAIAACTVFAFGFFALNVFYLLGFGRMRLPGLYTFRAATIGDGILLPLLAYSLLRSVDLGRLRKSWLQAAFAAGGGILGVVVGAGIEVYDLSSPTAPLDWTFPAPHRYDLAGWYHTLFLIVAAGFYGAALALALVQLREQARRDSAGAIGRLRSVGVLGALFPGLAFICLFEEDDLTAYRHLFIIVVATMIGMGIVLGGLLTWACGMRNIRWCAFAVIGSMLPALALSGFVVPGEGVRPASIAIACVVGLAALAASLCLERRAKPGGTARRSREKRSREKRGRRRADRGLRLSAACLVASVTVCAAGPAYAISAQKALTLSQVIFCLLAGLVLASCEFGTLQSLISVRAKTCGAGRPERSLHGSLCSK